MIFSTNGFIDPGNNDSTTAGDPRIVELSSNSSFSGSLDNLAGNNNRTIVNSEATQSIITTPETEALSLMPPPPVPVRRSQFASQQQQQQTSDAAMALLSSLDSANAQATNTTNNNSSKPSRSSSARQRNASNTGIAQIPSSPSSTSQSLQPLNRATNGARGNVAAFLTKSYNMVNEPTSNNLIKWSDDGQSFIVVNHVEFAKEVLPKFFKHNNFSSFVRQLNMYGFHKVPHLQQGVLMPNSESEQWEFSNPHFQRNQPDLLNLVSRKKASGGNDDKDALTMDLGHILQEVTAIKRHQVAISTDLKNIERDHLSLWQESLVARERHQRQQETIDKILRFLASVFSGDKKRALVPNKKARLTITDGEIDGSSSVDDGRRLVEEEEDEEDDGRDETLPGGKRKRPTTNDGTQVMDGILNSNPSLLNIGDVNPAILAMLINAKQTGNSMQNQMSPATPMATTASSNLPAVSTISSTTPNLNFPDYLTTLPTFNYPNINNNTINNALPGGFKFDPSNLTIPTSLLPNALSSVHHDMLRSISMANAQDAIQTPPPLAPLPPSLSQTTAGTSVIKGVDQITQEMEQLQRSIEALSQHGLIADHFDFDDDTYLSLADSYDSNGLGNLAPYSGMIGNEDSSKAILPTMFSAVPTSPMSANTTMANTNLQGSSSSVGANPRISTVGEDDLEDLLDMDPV